MHTKQSIKRQIEELGIKGTDTLLIHSSMKAIGKTEDGVDGVLDAFIEYMKDGLLVFPTHTWQQINEEYNIFDVKNEPSCVGILSNIFIKRPRVIRSLHPTHSVAAMGKDAEEFTSGEEKWETPCPRLGCWGKLYDRAAKVLFIGCSLKKNTLLHAVEEWSNIPNRIFDCYQYLKIITPDNRLIDRPSRRHFAGTSENYDKIEDALLEKGIAEKGETGDAESILCDVRKMVDLTAGFLEKDPDLFSSSEPIPKDWYI